MTPALQLNVPSALALIEIIREAGSAPVAAAFLVEKCSKRGHDAIIAAGVPEATLAQVESLEGGRPILRGA